MTLLHVEVLTESNQKPEIIINFLMETFCSVQTHTTITENLPDQIKQIRICESSPQQPLISLSSAELRIYQFQYRKDSFPLEIYSDLWDSLVFDNEIKSKLINFILTGFLFADLRVNPQIISVNKLILLYGPPGTGKTSLCRALVQKIAIRFKERFQDGGKLIELQSGKLLSKYFSESNKLVLAQFREIQELLSNNNQFVVLLMDEVESLAACRNVIFDLIEITWWWGTNGRD
jgi:SpoVK/Ycf46/Vps4 family AAA+-type ATPase